MILLPAPKFRLKLQNLFVSFHSKHRLGVVPRQGMSGDVIKAEVWRRYYAMAKVENERILLGYLSLQHPPTPLVLSHPSLMCACLHGWHERHFAYGRGRMPEWAKVRNRAIVKPSPARSMCTA